jgi:voltage-gated potassium channel
MTAALAPPLPGPFETLRARWMFALSCVFLLLLSYVLHHQQPLDFTDPEKLLSDLNNSQLHLPLFVLACLWPVFVVEAAVRFCQSDRARGTWKMAASALLLALLPPLRLAARSPGAGTHVWLPVIGWRPVDKRLRKQLARLFSVPMVVLALLVLPLLLIEVFWPEQSQSNPTLRFCLEAGSSFIWFAFAFEFIVQVQVSDKRLTYCLTHWIDLLIICLPVVQFLPLLRAFRLARLLRQEQLTRLSMTYRLQALVLRMWQWLLMLQLIQRIIGWSLERQLKGLQGRLALRMEELEDLRLEIEEVKQKLSKQKAHPQTSSKAVVVAVSAGDDARPLSDAVTPPHAKDPNPEPAVAFKK